MGKMWKPCQISFSWAAKSMRMVTAATKLRCLLLGRMAMTNLEMACDAAEDSREFLRQQGDQSTLNIHWKDWSWSWSANTLATWFEEPIHWKRPWCWERSSAGGEGDKRGWGGWLASLAQRAWVWANSGW